MGTASSVRTRDRYWWTASVTGMASYIDAAAIVSSGTALVIYQQALGLQPADIGVLSATLTTCIGIGALVGGRLGDRFGRKRVFSTTMAVVVIGAAALVFATSLPFLLVATALVGLGTGADLPVSLATIAEAAKASNRGAMVSFSQALWKAGMLVSYAIGAIAGNWGRIGGQILFGHIAVVALVVLVLRLSIAESKDWLSARDAIAAGTVEQISGKDKLRLLLKPPYVQAFIALMVFYVLTNLAANTFGQYGTYLMVNVVGEPVNVLPTINIFGNALGIILMLIFMKFVDGPHRMRIFYVGAVFGLAAMIIPATVGVTFVTVVTAQACLWFMFAWSFEPIMKVWTQESFPTLLRSTAQGTIIAVGRFGAAILAGLTPMIVQFGAVYLFIFLAVAVAVGLAAAIAVFRKPRHTEFEDAGEPAELVPAE